MKICLLSRFFDLRNAGIGRYSQELLKGLAKRGFDVRTVSQDGGLPLGEGNLKYLIYTAFEIRFKIPSSDIYHACSPIEAIHAPKPLVVTFHDFIPMISLHEIETHYATGFLRGFRRSFVANYFRTACSIAIKKGSAMIAQSEQTKQELVREFGINAEKVAVIRLGIRPDLEPKPKTDNILRVGTLGYLDPRKRMDLLIKAFLKADIDGELVIAGKGIEYPRLEALAGSDSRIKFLGFLPDNKLVDFYNSLDVFIFPTKVEGYGLPMVEAMACGKPVVTLSDCVIPSDIKDKTIVVDDLAEWFKNLNFSGIDLDENRKFAKCHNWEKCVEEHIKIYRSHLTSKAEGYSGE